MVNYAIDFGDIERLQAAYERAPEVVREELEFAVGEATLFIYRELSERVPVGAGGASGLKGSLFHEQEVVGAKASGLVATAISYAAPVELGTRPHFPPVEPLVEWVRAKLGIASAREARSVAYAIATKIARQGTKPQPSFGETFEEVDDQVRDMFNHAAERIARRIAGGEAA